MDIPGFLALGLVDGLNICSISLLALYLSLLYTANANRRVILTTGIMYISGVFTSYLLAGMGILILAVSVPAPPHLLSRLAAGVMLFVGLANVLNYFHPNLIPLNFTPTLGRRAISLMRSGGMGSAGAAGLLVGLHNFPCACTGGIYPTVITMVAGSELAALYLVLYNLLFILPLAVILYVCSSKTVALAFRRRLQENRPKALLSIGLVMVASGLIILLALATGAA